MQLPRRLVALPWLVLPLASCQPEGPAPAAPRAVEPAPQPPASVDLRPALDGLGLGPRAQGPRGTCSVFTTCEALEFALAKSTGKPLRLSVEHLNWAANEASGRVDDGSFFHEAIAGFERFGACSEAAMPYAASFDSHGVPPPGAATEAAAIRPVIAEKLAVHWIVPWQSGQRGVRPEQIEAIKAVLASGYPVAAGSGHSRLLVGYRDDPAAEGGGIFLTEDSALARYDQVTYRFVADQVCDVFWVEAK